MDDLPEWTPGPGEYVLPTDFVKKTREDHTLEELGEGPVQIVPDWDQKGNAFGRGGRDDLKRKDPMYPGAGTYEAKDSFKKTVKKGIKRKSPSGQTYKLDYPHAYDVREVNNGIKTSFGMATLNPT